MLITAGALHSTHHVRKKRFPLRWTHNNKMQGKACPVHCCAGAKLLAKMGWVRGEGLGAAHQGIATPLRPTVRRSKTGLGSNPFVKLMSTRTTHFRPAGVPGAAAGKENARH